jgi:hypothetical protein
MSGKVTKQERVVDTYQGSEPSGIEVMELMVRLPRNQFFALEAVAFRLNLTVGQLIRRTISDFLLTRILPRTLSASEMGNDA